MKKTLLRPTLSESLYLLAWVVTAVLLIYAAYLGSWALGYNGDFRSGYVITKKWSPDMFTLGLFLFGIILLAGATELLARSVVVEGEFVSSRSPLGLYRQTLRRAVIGDFRITRILGWGRVLEVLLDGK